MLFESYSQFVYLMFGSCLCYSFKHTLSLLVKECIGMYYCVVQGDLVVSALGLYLYV